MGHKKGKIYNLWSDLKKRARKQNTYLCKEWNDSFEVFKEWAYSNGYIEGEKTLIRKDSNLGLEPSNCEFVDRYSNHKTHGEANSKLYKMFKSLNQKCYNKKNPNYKSFGAKGIKIAEEWKHFEDFREWAYSNGYEEGLLLDRKDLDKDFSEENCFFTTINNHSKIRKSILSKEDSEHPNFKHGQYNSRLYRIWGGMKARCLNPNQKDYHNYGGRGIKVCEEWLDFNNFYIWALDNGYEEHLSIDRNDFNGDYEPKNCSWKTTKEQSVNKRQNHFVTIGEETKTISEWSEISGIPPKTLRYRIVNNWRDEDLFSPPDRSKRRDKKE